MDNVFPAFRCQNVMFYLHFFLNYNSKSWNHCPWYCMTMGRLRQPFWYKCNITLKEPRVFEVSNLMIPTIMVPRKKHYVAVATPTYVGASIWQGALYAIMRHYSGVRNLRSEKWAVYFQWTSFLGKHFNMDSVTRQGTQAKHLMMQMKTSPVIKDINHALWG